MLEICQAAKDAGLVIAKGVIQALEQEGAPPQDDESVYRIAAPIERIVQKAIEEEFRRREDPDDLLPHPERFE